MGKPEPSMDEWLAEAKASENADKCGMFLTHNGIVRSTAKAQVRNGEEMPLVAQVDFSYDAAGVEAAIAEALTWDGVYYVKVWLNALHRRASEPRRQDQERFGRREGSLRPVKNR